MHTSYEKKSWRFCWRTWEPHRASAAEITWKSPISKQALVFLTFVEWDSIVHLHLEPFFQQPVLLVVIHWDCNWYYKYAVVRLECIDEEYCWIYCHKFFMQISPESCDQTLWNWCFLWQEYSSFVPVVRYSRVFSHCSNWMLRWLQLFLSLSLPHKQFSLALCDRWENWI